MADKKKKLDDLDDSAVIARYIERLMTLDGSRDKELDESDLREVARELGLSEDDLAQVDASVAAHRKRGENFLAHDSHDDAISELRQALVLCPLDAELACMVGRAHHLRALAAGKSASDDDRQEAEKLARRAIALDADCKPAYQLLQDIREGRPGAGPGAASIVAEGKPVQRASGTQSRGLLLPGVMVLALAGAGLASFLVMAPVPVPEPVVASGPVGEPVPAPAVIETVSAPGLQHITIPSDSSEYRIPVVFLDGGAPEHAVGLQLEIERSRVNRFLGKSFSYTFRGTLAVTGQELHELKVRLDLLSSDNQVLVQKYHEIHSKHRPPLRPGDAARVDILVHESRAAPAISGARLVVELAQRFPAADDYGEAPVVPLEWTRDRPHIQVVVRERQSQVKQLFDTPSHWLVLDYENQGKRPIRGLKARFTWFDASGRKLAHKDSLLVSTASAALPGGQTWVTRIIGELPKNLPDLQKPFARYTMTIIEAE